MSITNLNKPATGNEETNLLIGGGFALLIGGIYKLIISPVNTAGIINNSKVSIGETWGTWSTAWEDETRNWLELSQLITNVPTITIGSVWSAKNRPWLNQFVWNDNFISNFNKPV